MHDVVIVGAGPAGCVAATVLARAGARVLVLERATFPRDKLCGDTLNPGALALLARLGLGHVVAGALPLDGMIVTGSPATRVVGRYESGDGEPLQGQSLSRRDLDHALAAAASRAGGQVDEGVLVQGPLVVASGGIDVVAGVVVKGADGRTLPMRSRVVIAADGRHSRVGRSLGLSRATRHPRRWAIGAYFEGVGGMTTLGEMHVRRTHYLGVAPLPGGITNACLVVSHLDGRSRTDLLWHFLRSDALLRERFAAARMCAEPACLGPLGVDCDGAGAPGLLLAGDAAGFVDPITGDGLRFAIRGGELAAEEALRVLDRGGVADAHVRLAASRAREFSHKWRFNRSLRTLVAHPGAIRVAGYAAAVAPAILRRAIRYAGDVYAA